MNNTKENSSGQGNQGKLEIFMDIYLKYQYYGMFTGTIKSCVL